MTDVLIDELDRPLLVTHALTKDGMYIQARNRATGVSRSLHRLIMNPPAHLVVDHLDSNGYNNRRSNLRVCTKSANSNNVLGSVLFNALPFCGVVWDTDAWEARVCVDSKVEVLGRYSQVEEANAVYADSVQPRCSCAGQRPDKEMLRQIYDVDTGRGEILVFHVPAGWKEKLKEIAIKEERSFSYLTRKALSSTYPQLTASEDRTNEAEKGSQK